MRFTILTNGNEIPIAISFYSLYEIPIARFIQFLEITHFICNFTIQEQCKGMKIPFPFHSRNAKGTKVNKPLLLLLFFLI